ncbi:MAG: hypothetical protein R3F31_20680 [Verrucomicrobiales bacterium]
MIYHKAVQWALTYGEFHKPAEIAAADQLLATGQACAQSLRQERPRGPVRPARSSAATAPALTAQSSLRPRHSRPATTSTIPARPGFLFHGRGETSANSSLPPRTEKATGPIAPEGAIVLHPYGRYRAAPTSSPARSTPSRRSPRPSRITGSMTTASLSAAFPWAGPPPGILPADRWCAAQPGAGFSETPDFLRVYQGETLTPPPWQKTLWHWYDCTDWAVNVSNLPLVAYSGDRQAEAGRRRHGGRSRQGKDPSRPPHRAGHGPSDRSRLRRRD